MHIAEARARARAMLARCIRQLRTDLVPVEAGDDLRGTGEHQEQKEDGGVDNVQNLHPPRWGDVLTGHEETTPANLTCYNRQVLCHEVRQMAGIGSRHRDTTDSGTSADRQTDRQTERQRDRWWYYGVQF